LNSGAFRMDPGHPIRHAQDHEHPPRTRAPIRSPSHGPHGSRESADSGHGDADPASRRIWTNRSDEQHTVQLHLRAWIRLAVSDRCTGNRRGRVRGTPRAHTVTAATTAVASTDRPTGITVLSVGGVVSHRPCGATDTVGGNPPLCRRRRLLLRSARRVVVVPGPVRPAHSDTPCRTTPPDDRGECGDTGRRPHESTGTASRRGAPDTRSAAADPVPRPVGDPRSAAAHPECPTPATQVRGEKACLSPPVANPLAWAANTRGATDVLPATGGCPTVTVWTATARSLTRSTSRSPPSP